MLDIKFDETRDQWKVELEVNGHLKTLGYFDSVVDALRAKPEEFSWLD
jgi:hypothetical protein